MPQTPIEIRPGYLPGLMASLALSLLAGCNDGTRPAADSPGPLSPAAALGEQIFSDPTLSASGQMSCASCHVSLAAHAPANALPVQPGGPALDQQGSRQAPSIRYLATNTAFHFDGEGTPTGGFFWDGRAASLQEQAGAPFLNPVEMALPSQDAVVDRLTLAPYAETFRQVFGAGIFSNPGIAFERMTFAIQQFEKESAALHGFTSKYDAVLDGKATLSEQELRGLALFNNPQKGNCAACHPSGRNADGSHPLFTDFSYDALGVPRNPDIPKNADPSWFDLGLCARPAGDMAARPDLCGAFKVPSLRNVTQRRSYFHNGYFHDLKTALQFYVQRDTDPEKWYPAISGAVQKFNDLPPRYHTNVNTTEAPYNRKPGDEPALSDSEIDDVIAFLQTLNDGYSAP